MNTAQGLLVAVVAGAALRGDRGYALTEFDCQFLQHGAPVIEQILPGGRRLSRPRFALRSKLFRLAILLKSLGSRQDIPGFCETGETEISPSLQSGESNGGDDSGVGNGV